VKESRNVGHDGIALLIFLLKPDHPIPQRLPVMPPILADSAGELPSSIAAIANSRRACAASFTQGLGLYSPTAPQWLSPWQTTLRLPC
jgi:hypothetical protein